MIKLIPILMDYLQTVVTSISHHQTQPKFATCGEICQLWEEDRNEPVQTFKWGVDSLHEVSFNPIETDLLGKFHHDTSRRSILNLNENSRKSDFTLQYKHNPYK